MGETWLCCRNKLTFWDVGLEYGSDNCLLQGSTFLVVRQPQSAENSTRLPFYTDIFLIYCGFILQKKMVEIVLISLFTSAMTLYIFSCEFIRR